MNLLKLIRLKDWLKNIIIFFPLIFSGYFFDRTLYFDLFIVFFTFCLISSFIYVLNDILDIKRDKLHPIKKITKPLASGKISLKYSYTILVLITLIILIISIPQDRMYLNFFLYFILGIVYNLYFKKIPYLEIIILSLGYVVRIDSGSVIINVESSLLMLSSVFFLATYFISLKRLSEMNLNLDNVLNNTRDVIKIYDKKIINFLSVISLLIILIIFTVYLFTVSLKLFITLPLLLVFLLRYYYIVKNTTIGENPINVVLWNNFLLLFSLLILLSTFISYF